jgi:hypothetical protein
MALNLARSILGVRDERSRLAELVDHHLRHLLDGDVQPGPER